MLLTWMTVVAVLLTGVAFLFFRTEGRGLPSFRKIAFALGTVANLATTIALLVFLIAAHKTGHRTMHPVDLDRAYPVHSLLGLGLLAAILALFGRRISQVLLLIAGLLAACLWYLAGRVPHP